MIEKIDKNLIELAKSLKKPLYVVGGAVRNYILSGEINTDLDLSAAIPITELIAELEKRSFKVEAIYRRTNTVMFSIGEYKYEYTAFRAEKYISGEHTPYEIEFTEDIAVDAKRRDFRCNAVYYDIVSEKFIDILGGIPDIKNRVLTTADIPTKVFSNDGLRLMRLARFSAELNFSVGEETFSAAKTYCKNILDISAERIYEELTKILLSPEKYAFSDKQGAYHALKLLHKIGVLSLIMPELTDGENMAQRADFHNYDVLEHSFRTVLYADKTVRLSALLHDVGKPFAMQTFNKYAAHAEEGERIATAILTRLKASNSVIKETAFLVRNHMIDYNLEMKENKIKLFIVENYEFLEKLFLIKQADYSACKDELSVAPVITKWREILKTMRREKTPFSSAELKIKGRDLMDIGYVGDKIGKKLNELFKLCVIEPRFNEREKLIKLSKIKVSGEK